MLQDDRHVFRVARAHALGESHAGRRCVECDLEVMLARQAFLRRVRQNGAHDAAQGRLRENVVTNVVGGHGENQSLGAGNSVSRYGMISGGPDRSVLR
jgi:hypothetical protein